MNEIRQPYRYFLRKSDFPFIYPAYLKGGVQAPELSEEFLDFIAQSHYKKAEKWLLERENHPYYLLNLILLYAYMDQKEYLNLMAVWEKSVQCPPKQSCKTDVQENLQNVLTSRHMDRAVKIFFKHQKTSNQEASDLPDFKRQLSPRELEQLRSGIYEKKYTYDVLKKYLENLRLFGEWEKMENFIKNIPWAGQDQKRKLLQKMEQWKKQDNNSQKPSAKVKILN